MNTTLAILASYVVTAGYFGFAVIMEKAHVITAALEHAVK